MAGCARVWAYRAEAPLPPVQRDATSDKSMANTTFGGARRRDSESGQR